MAAQAHRGHYFSKRRLGTTRLGVRLHVPTRLKPKFEDSRT